MDTGTRVEDRHGLRLLRLDGRTTVVATSDDVSDLVGGAWAAGADVVVVPVEGVAPAFFDLRSGLAGDVLQKVTNYHVVLAVLGDVSALTAASTSLRDLVRETDRGVHAWFVPDDAALDERLQRLAASRAARG
ncbi:DUF4180 domain-containing protein [Aquipuribacter hungaricus]|uniref:DUF4180 domain-containing protein n=1 Tax=Aquipuribacter hungaricus TaxID=545624 RepID=A0ABV7WF08_9MICO